MKKTSLWKIVYKPGLRPDLTVEAETCEEAAKIAVGEFRRTYGADGILDFRKPVELISSISKI